MGLQLTGRAGPLAGEVFPLREDKPTHIGRGDDNDVVVASKRVSHRHAYIVADADAFLIHDLSRNGTRVNGQRISLHQLQVGDEIALGEQVFRVEHAAGDQLTVDDQQTIDDQQPNDDSGVRAQLLVRSGVLAGQTFSLPTDRPIRLGRATDNDIIVDSNRVSRHQAEITPDGAGFAIQNLMSRNATRVNGRPISRHRLQSGDEIAFAGQRFQFTLAADGAEESSEPARPPAVLIAAAEQAAVLEMPQGIRCPGRCGRVYPFDLEHCPLDGALLANGQTVFS